MSIFNIKPSEEEPISDLEAIGSLKSGNLEGLDVLIVRYQLRAVRSAYLIVRERSLADDIVQEAFVQLVDKIHKFDETRPFAPWFLRCVINDALKATKRQKRWVVSLDEAESVQTVELFAALTDIQPNPEEQAINSETCREVWQALERLTPEQRAVIVLKYYLGCSEAEMSATLQRPSGTVKWLLHAARKRLQSLLVTFETSAITEEEEE